MSTQTRNLLSRRDVAELLGVHPDTIDRWRNGGDFPQPVYLPGRTIRWRPQDIDAWIDGNSADSAATLRSAATEAMGL